MSDELYKELLKNMPCLYDLQVQMARNITKLTSSAFQKARWSTGTGKQWPFVLVKNNEYIMNWAQIRERRTNAVHEASPKMKKILINAEKAAHLMRVWNMPETARIALEAVPFPFNPEGDEEAGDNDIPEGQSELTAAQISRILPFMIDIPVTNAAKILKISQHTMMAVRRNIGLKDWPLEELRRGNYYMSSEEVDHKRREMISTAEKGSVEHRMLLAAKDWHDAKKEVADVVRKAKRARLDTQTKNMPPQEQEETAVQPMMAMEAEYHEDEVQEDTLYNAVPLIEDPVSEEDHELKDWFASLLDEEEQKKETRFWYDEGQDMTPEQQAYWDSLIDPIPDHI